MLPTRPQPPPPHNITTYIRPAAAASTKGKKKNIGVKKMPNGTAWLHGGRVASKSPAFGHDVGLQDSSSHLVLRHVQRMGSCMEYGIPCHTRWPLFSPAVITECHRRRKKKRSKGLKIPSGNRPFCCRMESSGGQGGARKQGRVKKKKRAHNQHGIWLQYDITGAAAFSIGA